MDRPPLPFDPSQKLFILKPGVHAEAAIHPERFHAHRQEQERREADEPAMPDELLWSELPRAALLDGLFEDRPLRLVALTTDAGLGKTYNLSWLHCELNDGKREQSVFLLPIGALESSLDLISKKLVPLVRKAPGNEAEDPERLKADLERRRQRGQLILLFDGLDMAGTPQVDALADLLKPGGEWSRCRIVLAGRPFAIARHRARLFAGPPWVYVQIAEFTSKQQRRALGKVPSGKDRYDFIPADARAILTIPRVLENLQPLDEDALGELQTVSDVYWQASKYMLDIALRATTSDFKRLDFERLLAVLGALAFSMYARTETDQETGEQYPNLERLAAGDMSEFIWEVLDRLQKVEPRYQHDASAYELLKEKDLQRLNELNGVLSHGWLDNVIGEDQDLLWRNASLQEFFAAYWVTRWGTPADLERLGGWVVDPLTDFNRGFYWLWRYASEMPDEAIRPGTRKPATWQAAMAPLYDGSLQKVQPPIRSTEFIYRNWQRMEDWQPALLKKFTGEFPSLHARDNGDQKKQIAQKLVENGAFIPLVKSGRPSDSETFWMGAPADECPEYDGSGDQQDNRLHQVTLTGFLLHRFCVTNREYELFDPRHENSRWDGTHPAVEKNGQGADDLCPVVNVSWYDACCFAKWLGTVVHGGEAYRIQLPTEARWEFGCRAGAGPETPFSFQEGHKGTSCTPDICNFDGRSPWPEGAAVPEGKDVEIYRKCTIPVDGLSANRWGLFQMHGNVWEWCVDWFAAGFYNSEQGRMANPCNEEAASARVLRGGCWFDDGRSCRSAARVRSAPAYRYRNGGFRLAAVPVVGAKHVN